MESETAKRRAERDQLLKDEEAARLRAEERRLKEEALRLRNANKTILVITKDIKPKTGN